MAGVQENWQDLLMAGERLKERKKGKMTSEFLSLSGSNTVDLEPEYKNRI